MFNLTDQLPDVPAIKAGEQILSYVQLEQVSAQLAQQLQQVGIDEGDKVALDVKQRVLAVVAMIACHRLGAIFIPFDDKLSQTQRHQLGAQWLIADRFEENPEASRLLDSVELLQSKLGVYQFEQQNPSEANLPAQCVAGFILAQEQKVFAPSRELLEQLSANHRTLTLPQGPMTWAVCHQLTTPAFVIDVMAAFAAGATVLLDIEPSDVDAEMLGEQLEMRQVSLLSLDEQDLLQLGSEFDFVLEDLSATLNGILLYCANFFDAVAPSSLPSQEDIAIIVVNPRERVENLDSYILPLHNAPVCIDTLLRWNDTACDYGKDVSLIALIFENLEANAESVVSVFEDEALSGAQIKDLVEQMAGSLVAQGVGHGSRVGVMMARSNALLVTLLAIMRAGAAYVPLDPDNPPERLSFMVDDAQLSLVILQSAFAQKLSNGLIEQLTVDTINDIPQCFGGAGQLPAMPGADCPAYMIYTSGSTGTPKGVLLGHRAIVNRLRWMADEYQVGDKDVILQKTPYSFDVSVWELFLPLLCGAKLVFAKPQGHKDAKYLGELIEAQGVTIMHFVPSMLRAFINAEPGTCSTLQQVFCSGEALTTDLAERFLARFDAKLHNLYGPTEAAVDVSYWQCLAGQNDNGVPIGRPIKNIQLFVVDQNDQPLGAGVEGELLIGGVGLAEEYFNRPELTAEKFVELDLFGLGAQRLYRTGDLVKYRDDGVIDYLGRIDFQVKIRGNRVEIGEIEAVIRLLDGVEDAVVTVQSGSAGQQVLVAYYQSKQPLDEAKLEQLVALRLPEYMVPSVWQPLQQLPLGATGKLDRKALPEVDFAARAGQGDEDATPMEAELRQLWCTILSLENIALDEDLFRLGCDSILGLTFISALKRQGHELQLKDIFAYPTIKAQAAYLGNNSAVQAIAEPQWVIAPQDSAKIPQGIADIYPLTKLQMGLIYQTELHKGTAVYHDIMCYRFKGVWREDLFRQALQQMVSHHSILRTSFNLTGYSEPMQCVHEQLEPDLRVTCLRGQSEQQQAQYHQDFITQERTRVYDWQTAPIHYFVQVLSDDEYRFVLSLHDSLLDGWSVSLFITQLYECYHALVQHNAVKLLPAVIEFKQMVAQERAILAGADAKSFWLELLSDATPSMVGQHWFKETGGNGQIVQYPVAIEAEHSERLKDIAKSAGVSIKSVLLAAHVRVCALMLGTDDVICGLEHNGRPELPGAESSLGLFLNTLPFRMVLKNETWAELIARVHQQEVAILPHRAYPYVQMLRDQHFDDLFDTVFNFVNFHVLREALHSEESPTQLTQFDNVLETEYALRAEFSVNVQSDAVELLLHYSNAKFSGEVIEQLGRYYQYALQAIVDDFDRPVRESIILPEQEFALTRFGLGYHEYAFERHLTFVDRFAQVCTEHHQAEAVVYGEQHWSYAQLSERVNHYVGLLEANDFNPQSCVFILADRSADFLAAMMAIFSVGGIYVPLDPRNPVARMNNMVHSCGGGIVIHSDQYADIAEQVCQQAKVCLTSAPLQGEQVLSPSGRYSAPKAEDIAYIIFTSGSTGLPKGATVNHLGMLNHLFSKVVDLDIQSRDRLLHTSPQSFDISIWQFLCTLLVGGTVVIGEDDAVVDPLRIAQLIGDKQITIVELVPALLQGLVNTSATPSDFTHLRFMLSTGEALKSSLACQWFERFGDIPLVNAFGPTECSDDVTHHTLYESPKDNSTTVPIGTAIINTELYLLDPLGHPVPQGVPGELFIGGICLGNGYIADPVKTDAAFVQGASSWDADKKLYRSGDLVKQLDDGALLFLNRIDGQVKVGGHRIEVGELESQLSAHPGVENVVVVLTKDKRLVACIGQSQQQRLDAAELQQWAKARLASYMLPGQYQFFEQLPVTLNGKIDRKRLSEMDFSQSSQASDIIQQPSNADEQTIADIWQRLLNRNIDIAVNFFEVGGDSLLLLQLQSSLNEAFNVNVNLVALLEHSTVVAQARLLRGLCAEQCGETTRAAEPVRKRKIKKRKRSDRAVESVE